MKLDIRDIDDAVKELTYTQNLDALNRVLHAGKRSDFNFSSPANVALEYHRSGEEIFFVGEISAQSNGICGRCTDNCQLEINCPFSVVLAPRQPLPEDLQLDDEDLDISYYEGEEIDLEPLIHERIILQLPMRPLCSDACLGLCEQCGANLNREECDCRKDGGDPRLAVLRNLRVDELKKWEKPVRDGRSKKRLRKQSKGV